MSAVADAPLATTAALPAGGAGMRAIPGLAWADLRHEALLTACLVLATAAVLAPLLLLIGLKHGVVETLRGRLVEDPVYREIRPTQTQDLPEEFFTDLARRPEVQFILPGITRGASLVAMIKPATGDRLRVDMLPTGPDDPLLLENGAPVPGEAEVVLSKEAAHRLSVRPGDALTLQVTRDRNRRLEAAELPVKVAGVLAARADAQARAYLPLSLVMDIESYREGNAVASRGWAGGLARPAPRLDGVFVVSPTPLDSMVEAGLAINTGFAGVQESDAVRLRQLSGVAVPPGSAVRELRAVGATAAWAAVDIVRGKLRGQQAAVFPYAVLAGLTLSEVTGSALPVAALAVDAEAKELLGIESPWPAVSEDAAFVDMAVALLPKSLGVQPGGTVIARFVGGPAPVEFPLSVRGVTDGDRIVVPAALAGLLRSASERPFDYSKEAGGFVLRQATYRGFRLYTRSIDQVPTLYRSLQDGGTPVTAQVMAIERIQELDRGLSRMFWLIAVVGICGGAAALAASLMGSVQRKRRELSLLRLLGLPRSAIVAFPIVQSAFIAVLCCAAAFGLYAPIATAINEVFGRDLQIGERVCHLPLPHAAVAVATTLGVAFLSSLLAAWRTTRIDPADALRDE